MLHTLIVSGSHRSKSQSEKVARYLANRVSALAPDESAEVVTLAGNPLPLWDEGVWDRTPSWAQVWAPFSEKLQRAEALVFVVPEWNGMVPPGFKNFLLLCSDRKELAHKPVLLVTVSAGQGGSYPITELRSSGYKNTYPCYLPEHIIVRHAEEVLNGDAPNLAQQEDKLRVRIDHCLKLLHAYGKALKEVRANAELNLGTYPSGM